MTVTATTGSATFDGKVQSAGTFQATANGITLNGNVTTTLGDVLLAGGAGNITLADNVKVNAFGNLTMGAAGGEKGLGNLVLQAGTNVLVQNNVIAGELGDVVKPPLALRLITRFPFLRRLLGRLIGLGVRPEHVRSPQA